MCETDSAPARSHWIIVGSADNLERTRALDFAMQGIKSRHRKKAERMRPDDKIVYYVTGAKVFAAVSTITSTYFESHEPIWQSGDPKKASEDYPFRVRTSPEIVLASGDGVPAEPLARKMEYAGRWPAANWTLAFQGNVHEINESDYRLIASALARRRDGGSP